MRSISLPREENMSSALTLPIRRPVILCLLALGPALCQAQPGPVVGWGSYLGGRHKPAAGDEYMAVCAGGYHSLALTVDGTLVAWGENMKGQCDVPPGRDFVAIAAGLYHSLALKTNGTVVAWGDNSRGQCRVPQGRKFLAIAAGSWHSLAIGSDGSLAAWGWNDQGQCDVPPGNDYVNVAGGFSHSLALKSDRSLVAWGANGDGQCNVPPGRDFIDIAAGSLHNVALRANGTLVAWGRSGEGQCKVPAGSDFVAVAAGNLHGLALKRDGSIVAWGPNSYAQCDVPSEGHFATIAAGGFHSLAIRGYRVVSSETLREEAAADRRAKDREAAVAKAMVSDKVTEVKNQPAPDGGTKRQESAPAPLLDARPATAKEPNAPANRPNAGVGAAGAVTTAESPKLAVAEPNTTSRPDASRAIQAVAVQITPVKEPLPAEPNTPESRLKAGGSTAVVPLPDASKATVAEPNAATSRPGTVGKGEPASPSKKPTKTPAGVEPNTVAGKSAAAPGPTPPVKPPGAAEPNIAFNANDFFRESIAADTYVGADVNAVPVYHFVASSPTRHFCTLSEAEKYKLIDNPAGIWKYAGIAFFAYPEGKQPPGARPVYRFWSESLNRHFFTMNEREKELLLKQFAQVWKYQGVAWYVPPAKPPKKK
jgi:hypothetical protein